MFGGLFEPKVAKPMVSTLEDLHGDFQDGDVEVEMMRVLGDLAVKPGGPAALIAVGPVLDALFAGQFAGHTPQALVHTTFPKRARG